MILSNGEHWEPEQSDILAWQQAYKKIDVYGELDAMACWCEANPSKRKTSKGIKRFVNSWLNRANQSGGSPFNEPQKEGEALPVRRWTMLDMLTHDFMDSESFRNKMLEKHGQYITSKGVRHVRG
jgi:hypothetical protein